MKQIRLDFSLIVLFIFLVKGVDVSAQTVYVTKTGKKYHKSSCRYLSKSKRAIDYSDAKQFYSACSVCKPKPKGTSAKSSNSANKTSSASTIKSTKATSKRCSATTQSGTRCKRTTTSSSGKCWQHT